ncbi:hypothetical protein POM88_038159 [Heracleum sosnowskyi]|uniref:GYF domain-containing protein n=1 Tax=Heracleum sosnowskyi TaxID=360622 RepID=A0AAD8HRH1_9APIA|nr:hypothetical protein POM88_038159 [Heracleum sosnowskyi]
MWRAYVLESVGTESGGGDETLGNVCEVGWFLGSEDQHFGPYTVSELCDYFSRGTLTESTIVCPEGTTEWQPLSAIPGVISGISQQGNEYYDDSISAFLVIF